MISSEKMFKMGKKNGISSVLGDPDPFQDGTTPKQCFIMSLNLNYL